MSAETLRFVDVEVNKKEFHASKQPIALDLVDINQIVISELFKHNDKVSKHFIGYEDDDVIRLLCNALPRMSGYIKYFDNGAKNMSFVIENDSVLVKYNDIWNKILKKY